MVSELDVPDLIIDIPHQILNSPVNLNQDIYTHIDYPKDVDKA